MSGPRWASLFFSPAQHQERVVAKLQPNHEVKKLRLTVFLIKERYNKIEDFLEVAGLQRIQIGTAQAEYIERKLSKERG